MKVKCDVHEWMSAYLVPVTHPYVAVTDARGEFEIGQVPFTGPTLSWPGTKSWGLWSDRSQ